MQSTEMLQGAEARKPDTIITEPGEPQRVDESPATQETDSASSESSTARRLTRSQTAGVAKRRLPSDSAESNKPEGAPTKKARTASKQLSTAAGLGDGVSVPSAPTAPFSEPTSETEAQPLPMPRITFLEVSTAADAEGDRRISRSRAVFPVPVPNLTKKSRGRRVPTTDTMETAIVQPEKRVYVCKVDGCGKCFHRGEHLKRHIRSIHTHEKPFKCTYPQCGKFFNRHDNLLQHLKVHKEMKIAQSQKGISNASEAGTPPSRAASQALEGESPTSMAPDSPAVLRPRTIYDHQPNLYAGYVNAGPFESPAESMRFVTNMAVSSLRTEIPQSPTDPHPHPGAFPWHRPELMKDQLTY